MKHTLLIPTMLGIMTLAACDSSSSPLAGDPQPGDGSVPGTGQSSADEFEAAVVSANPAAGTFTLVTGAVIQVTGSTTIDPLGDLFSLTQVEAALNVGANVRAEGDQVFQGGMLRATNVKFEVDD
jgi:ABC-type phosphate transport system substrate-binding protein